MAWNEPGGNSNNQDPWGGRKGGDRKGPPDLDEAFRIGNRIVIMESGRIIQCGTPQQIVQNPAVKNNLDSIEEYDGSYTCKDICRIRYNIFKYMTNKVAHLLLLALSYKYSAPIPPTSLPIAPNKTEAPAATPKTTNPVPPVARPITNALPRAAPPNPPAIFELSTTVVRVFFQVYI